MIMSLRRIKVMVSACERVEAVVCSAEVGGSYAVSVGMPRRSYWFDTEEKAMAALPEFVAAEVASILRAERDAASVVEYEE
jgi:hypothetical protein